MAPFLGTAMVFKNGVRVTVYLEKFDYVKNSSEKFSLEVKKPNGLVYSIHDLSPENLIENIASVSGVF